MLCSCLGKQTRHHHIRYHDTCHRIYDIRGERAQMNDEKKTDVNDLNLKQFALLVEASRRHPLARLCDGSDNALTAFMVRSYVTKFADRPAGSDC